MDKAAAVKLERKPGAGSSGSPGAIGAYLRGQRELRGISPEELSRTTRIPLRSLERLEAGFFDGETDGFVRGFVRTVAEALGLDPSEAVARMLVEPASSASSGSGAPIQTGWAQRPLALALCGVIVFLAWGLLRWTREVSPPARAGLSDSVVLRVDPVRLLAESQAGERLMAVRVRDAEPPPGEVSASAPAIPYPSEAP
ncbi:MAG: helix-turn-helix domain-containing protein [Myxococcota bacterium]|nr:helix-turn-helix domain-containing protein [Myxococcota bacterium]